MVHTAPDGAGIRYAATGDGPTILATHGYAASSHMYEAVAPALARSHQVVTWDLRGHGGSDSPAEPAAYSVELAVGDMLALLDVVGADRAVLMGHSLGGFLSLELHRVAPDRVAALVLVDTGPGYRNPEARAAWNDMADRFARNFETRGLDALQRSDEIRADVHRGADGLAHAARGILRQCDAAVLEHLPDIDVPTLVVVGERDEPFLNGSRYMAERIPGAEILTIAGAAHAPMVSHPDAFLAGVEAFLAGLGQEPT